MQSWLVNGRRESAVGAADRGLAYGDGLFETIAVRQGVPRFLERHMARLVDGCRRLAIPDPPVRRISDELAQLIAADRRGTAKVIVTRGAGPRGYVPPADARPTRVIGFTPDEPADASNYRGMGVKIIACRTPYSWNGALAGLKTLNRLDNVLARSEWQDDSVSEGLMCDPEGRVIGGTRSNVFLVRGERLVTPALDRCGIRGVMRSLVIDSAREAGISCVETEVDPQQVAEADEVFLTNALIGMWPVASYGDRRYDPGRISHAIAAALAARGIEECGQ